jgi:hypothetical protein
LESSIGIYLLESLVSISKGEFSFTPVFDLMEESFALLLYVLDGVSLTVSSIESLLRVGLTVSSIGLDSFSIGSELELDSFLTGLDSFSIGADSFSTGVDSFSTAG